MNHIKCNDCGITFIKEYLSETFYCPNLHCIGTLKDVQKIGSLSGEKRR